MPRNVEIKASIESIESHLPLVAKIADSGPTEIVQDDTFFSCPNGRLKLRTLFKVGRTRIHLDRVEGLGDFMELEVVLADGESAESGMAVAHELLNRLAMKFNWCQNWLLWLCTWNCHGALSA